MFELLECLECGTHFAQFTQDLWEQFVSLDWSNGRQIRQEKKSNNQQRANLAGQIIALLGLLLHSEAKCHFLQ